MGMTSTLQDPREPVTVILPCHDEAPNIGPVVRRCRQVLADRPHEILVVDDGSRDGTAAVAAAAGARVVSLPRNRGKGVALSAGVRAANHELLVFMDGDGQDAPEDIPLLLAAVDEGAELAIGSRFLGVLHPGAIHPLNRVANRVFTALIALLFRARVTDSQAGFRAVRRATYLALKTAAREYDIETDMLLKALKRGVRVREVPVARYPRGGAATDFHRTRHGLMIFMAILRERIRP